MAKTDETESKVTQARKATVKRLDRFTWGMDGSIFDTIKWLWGFMVGVAHAFNEALAARRQERQARKNGGDD